MGSEIETMMTETTTANQAMVGVLKKRAARNKR
jgi:hypothetical protein